MKQLLVVLVILTALLLVACGGPFPPVDSSGTSTVVVEQARTSSGDERSMRLYLTKKDGTCTLWTNKDGEWWTFGEIDCDIRSYFRGHVK